MKKIIICAVISFSLLMSLSACNDSQNTTISTSSVPSSKVQSNTIDIKDIISILGEDTTKKESYKIIVDDINVVLSGKEKYNKIYIQLLDLVKDEVATNKISDKTKQLTKQVIDLLEKADSKSNTYQLSDDVRKCLIEKGIDPTEYEVNLKSTNEYLNDYRTSLTTLYEFINNNDCEDIQFECYCDMIVYYNLCKFDYYGINYFLADLKGEELEYLQTEVFNNLTTFTIDEKWYTDRNELEKLASDCLNEIEDIVNLKALDIEKKKLELDRLKNEIEKIK